MKYYRGPRIFNKYYLDVHGQGVVIVSCIQLHQLCGCLNGSRKLTVGVMDVGANS